MYLFADSGQGRHRLNHIVREISGVGGREPDTLDSRHGIYPVQEFGERAGRFQSFEAVGVHRLPQQGHFFGPVRGQMFDFGDNIPRGAAALLATGERDDAERAELIAPVHDGDERFQFAGRDALSLRQEQLRFLLLTRQFEFNENVPGLVLLGFAGFEEAVPLMNQFRDTLQLRGPGDNVNMGCASGNLGPGPLRHTASDANRQVRPRPFQFRQFAEFGGKPYLRVSAAPSRY